jgi:hypothetical protein
METAPPPPAASKLTLNDVVGYPRPGYDVPELYAFSPDDGLVTSLCAPERGTSSRNLYAFDTATGAFYLTLVPIRPRSRCERRSLRTFPDAPVDRDDETAVHAAADAFTLRRRR